MKFIAKSDIGKKRENNEDYYFVSDNENFPLYIIADGIGGHNSGEVASKMTVESISSSLKEINAYKNLDELEKDFVKAISDANKIVFDKAKNNPEMLNMGSTLTVLYKYKNSVLIGNVGDSRAYSITSSEIRQLTEDDTLVNSLYKLGKITKDEAINHPKRNMITNAVGTDLIIDINLIQYNYKPGEYILLCTDGLSDMVRDEEILSIFSSSNNLEEISDCLLEKALEAGGRDNITFIIIQL